MNCEINYVHFSYFFRKNLNYFCELCLQLDKCKQINIAFNKKKTNNTYCNRIDITYCE